MSIINGKSVEDWTEENHRDKNGQKKPTVIYKRGIISADT
jgi:hypothetical protein